MALSGSYDYNITANYIITEALGLIGAYDPGETLSGSDVVSCLRTLNMMVKNWQANNFYVWKLVNGVLFQEYGEKEYSIGPSGDHASASYVKTEIATAGSSGDGTLTVDDDTGISDGDAIGIELDDSTLQWTTVNGAPAANVVTLTASLTDDATVDNHVYTYTSLIQRPLEITEARLRNSEGNERPITIVARSDYMRHPNKDTSGTINEIYYEPTLTDGKIYTWQACNDVKEVIKITARLPIQDFDSKTNHPDCPAEWLLPLAWNLAVLLAPKYGQETSGKFEMRAEYMKQECFSLDRDPGSVFISVEPWTYR